MNNNPKRNTRANIDPFTVAPEVNSDTEDRGSVFSPKTTSLITPPTSKVVYVINRLKDEINTGIIRPGESIRQIALAKRYGVSQTPVREALRTMEAEGTITYAPHRGATVRKQTDAPESDLYLLRAEVEGIAAGMAAERASIVGRQKISAINDELVSAIHNGETNSLSILNRKLHFTIYEVGSPHIAEYVAILWSMLSPRVSMWQDFKLAKVLQLDHQVVVDAIIDGDPAAARNAMTSHILHSVSLHADKTADKDT